VIRSRVSDQVANGYELGRALSETYWALDPAAQRLVDEAGTELPNAACWQFLIGRERRMTISRLLQRLAPYFGSLVAPAISASVEVWGAVVSPERRRRHFSITKRCRSRMVADTWWQSPGARRRLREQNAIWYSLVVAGLDPETLLRPYAVLRSWRSLGKAFRVLLAETIVGFAGVALIAVFGVLVATASKQAAVEAVLASLRGRRNHRRDRSSTDQGEDPGGGGSPRAGPLHRPRCQPDHGDAVPSCHLPVPWDHPVASD